jgi:hypothetical protein
MTTATPGAEADKPAGGQPARHRFPALWPGALGMLFLLLAIIPTMPDEYYTALRYVVCGLSAAMMVLAVYCRRWEWIVPFVLLAALFNPIRWPGVGLKLWQLADLGGALLFLFAAYFIYPKPKKTAASAAAPPETPR